MDRPDKLVACPGVLVENVDNGRPRQHDVEHGRRVALLQNDPPRLVTTIEIAFLLINRILTLLYMNDSSFMSLIIVKTQRVGFKRLHILSLSLSRMVRLCSHFSLHLILSFYPSLSVGGRDCDKGVCVDRPLILHTAGKLYLCMHGVVLERGVVPHQSHDLSIKNHPYRHN